MDGYSFDRRRDPNRGFLPLGEILEKLSNAHQVDLKRGESPIAQATSKLLNRAFNSSHSYSDAARSQVTFNLATGTLAEQKERLRSDLSTQAYITDLIVEAYLAVNQLKDHPNIKEKLCDYLVRSGLQEKERFATRELLEVYCKETGKDIQVKESIFLAEALVILEKPPKIDSGEMLLDDLRKLTKDPKLWIVLLDNLIDEAVRGINQHVVIDCLKYNLTSLQGDFLIQGRLVSLASATDRISKRIHAQLFDIFQPAQHGESSDGPTFGIDDLL